LTLIPKINDFVNFGILTKALMQILKNRRFHRFKKIWMLIPNNR